jgi:hypothetical protein
MIIFLERKAFAAKISERIDQLYEGRSRLRKTFIIFDPAEKAWWVRIEVKEKGGHLEYDQTYILALNRRKHRKTYKSLDDAVTFLMESGVKRIVIDIPSE